MIGKAALGIVPHECDESCVGGSMLLVHFEFNNSTLLLILTLAIDLALLLIFAGLRQSTTVILIKLLILFLFAVEDSLRSQQMSM